MNAKERRKYIRDNTPRVRLMIAQLKMLDLPKWAAKIEAEFKSEQTWITAVNRVNRFEQSMPTEDYVLASGSTLFWGGSTWFGSPRTATPRQKFGKSKADQLHNLQAAQAQRQFRKTQREEVVSYDNVLDATRLYHKSIAELLGHGSSNQNIQALRAPTQVHQALSED